MDIDRKLLIKMSQRICRLNHIKDLFNMLPIYETYINLVC